MVSFTTTLASAVALLPLAQGILFNTVPSVTTGSDVTVTWSSVDTDPTEFSLYIWNFEVFPPYYEPVAFGVNTTAGTTTVKVPCDTPGSGTGYQFSAINGTNVYVIYAQTDKFALSAVPCSVPPLSTCAASTVTVTATCGSNGTKATPTPTGTGTRPGTVTATPTHSPSTVPFSMAPTLTSSWVTIAFGLVACWVML